MTKQSRPQWDDSFLHDLPAFERFAAEMRRWQIKSDDPFERADAVLWGHLSESEYRTSFVREFAQTLILQLIPTAAGT